MLKLDYDVTVIKMNKKEGDFSPAMLPAEGMFFFFYHFSHLEHMAFMKRSFTSVS
jgi:hypothetical protein